MSIDELKLRIKEAPISTIVGNYLSLTKKSGGGFLCVCPFHDDSHPSMNVSDPKGLFKCFACDAGGDSITFVQKFRNLDFLEALKEISPVVGLNYDDYVETKAKSPKELMIRKILVRANSLFQKIKDGDAETFKQFLENRKLSEEVAKDFSLGLTLKANTLTSYLHSIPDPKEKSYALKIATEIGIIRESKQDNQSHYDTFRERVIFPIWDQFGQIVGFGGRDITGNSKAKYLNSYESEIFKKTNILYGLNVAKPYVRENDSIILVEGYMDAVALHRYDFKNTVALMGLALGENSLKSITNLTKNIYLGLDSDEAGLKAMVRINRQFMDQGYLPRFISYSPVKDPDDFLKEVGSLEMKERINKAPYFLDYLINQSMEKYDLKTLDDKLLLLNDVFELISPLGPLLWAKEKAIEVATQIGLKSSSSEITESYSNFLMNKQKKTPQIARKTISPQPEKKQQVFDATKDLESITKLSKGERLLIEEMVAHPECASHKKITQVLDLVSKDEVKRFVYQLRDFIFEIDESEYPSMVVNLSSDDEYSLDIKEAIGAGIFKYVKSSLNEKVMEKLLNDFEFKLREEKLTSKRDYFLQQETQITTPDEREKILQIIFEAEKELNKLRSKKI